MREFVSALVGSHCVESERRFGLNNPAEPARMKTRLRGLCKSIICDDVERLEGHNE